MESEPIASHSMLHKTPLRHALGYVGASPLGVINQIPKPWRTTFSVLVFTVQNGNMQISQVANPDSPFADLLDSLRHVAEHPQMRPVVQQNLTERGNYVGAGIIFPLILVEISGDKVPSQMSQQEFGRLSKHRSPGVFATHNGKVIAGQYRRGRYEQTRFEFGNPDADPQGTAEALYSLHKAYCDLSVTTRRVPPKRLSELFLDA